MSSLASAARLAVSRQTALLQANIGVLGQKLDFMQALQTELGQEQAREKFALACPVVGASVGQHFRHSLDHMERVANTLEDATTTELHYDIRIRGGNDEHDLDAAKERIQRVSTVFRDEMDRLLVEKDAQQAGNMQVLACFLLSGDPKADEFLLSSTLERELGFVAHHAIHHLAMVKIIALKTFELLPPTALPEGFGTAPSTIVHEKTLK